MGIFILLMSFICRHTHGYLYIVNVLHLQTHTWVSLYSLFIFLHFLHIHIITVFMACHTIISHQLTGTHKHISRKKWKMTKFYYQLPKWKTTCHNTLTEKLRWDLRQTWRKASDQEDNNVRTWEEQTQQQPHPPSPPHNVVSSPFCSVAWTWPVHTPAQCVWWPHTGSWWRRHCPSPLPLIPPHPHYITWSFHLSVTLPGLDQFIDLHSAFDGHTQAVDDAAIAHPPSPLTPTT